MIKFIVLWVFEVLWFLSDLVIKPRMLPYEKGFQREVNCKKFDLQTYNNRIKQNFRIKSDYGYTLYCELIENEKKENKKIAILCHGFGCARYGCIKYADIFLKQGFHVLMYDHRNHGLSGKAHTSMGFYEKYDLVNVVDWCCNHYGEDYKIITYGESMGAATVLLHLGIDNRVKCTIADCSYSDMKALLYHQMKQYYHLPCFLIHIANYFIYFRAGFWLRKVSPIDVVSQTDIPVLFIHGKRDNFVPTYMSKKMYDAKKKNKAIYLVAKAKHAESYCMNREEYEKRVEDFLKKFL
ncbi:MAG TPA: alpha/beta hydrolase [Mobilitalea sp.]|nr:alpha/beta hydrolase [Mobilitalea sp.]